MATTTINTDLYFFDHGKRPHGRGHWCFFFDKELDVDAAFWVEGLQTYRDAKQQAIAAAKKRGAWLITVGS